MTKLEELIKELCPNGVPQKRLDESCNIFDNKRKPITKSAREFGIYPYYGANGIQDYVSDYIFDGTYILIGEDGSVITASGNPVVNWVTGKVWVNNHAHILGEKEGVLLRYLFHYIQTIDISSLVHGNIPKLTGGDLRALQIPVPPIPVQEEIVRILDSFTELTAELTANLTAEITARKKQYEYYRDSLLTFNSQAVQKVKLGDIASIVRGASPRPIAQYITSDSNGVNWIKIGDVKPNSKYITSTEEKITPEGAKKSRLVKKGDFILSNSMSFGRPYILKIDGCIHDGWLSISDFSNTLTADFLYHVLSSSMMQYEMRKKASFGGAVQNLNADIVRELTIPIPSLDTQNKIVQVLDNFDSICSDLKIGLPAEIEARRKQYEYYRDLLLSFASDSSQSVNVERERESRGRAER